MIRLFSLGFLLFALAGSPALADSATLLGVFKNWTAYSTGSGAGKVCYAISAPRATEPKGVRRGPIYLMISDWPARKVKGEPEIVVGYPYKPGAPVTLEMGQSRFAFFSRNQEKGGDGTAWLEDLTQMPALTGALTGSLSAVAIGHSTRGTRTVDTYSLAGFKQAMAKVHSACDM